MPIPLNLGQVKRTLIETQGSSREAHVARFLGHAMPTNPTRRQMGQTIGKVITILNTEWKYAQGKIEELGSTHENLPLYQAARSAHQAWQEREMTESVRETAVRAFTRAARNERYVNDVLQHVPK